MIGKRRAVAAVAALLVAAAGAVALSRERPDDLRPRPAAERPTLMLVTSLPLIFPEEFTLQGGGSSALKALETRYSVVPIGTTDAGSLKQAKLLLMAHPLAQPAENLVALDHWVRRGGRVLLLTDPRLDWPSKRPLGDKLRPPPSFADTGLLAHWELRLAAPDEAGPKQRELGGRTVRASSPGSLSGGCSVGSDGFVARCRVGNGRAIVVADADFLDVERPDDVNLQGLLAELAALER